MKPTLLLSLLLLFGTARSQDWEELSLEGGKKTYLSKSRLRRDGDVVTVWTKTVFSGQELVSVKRKLQAAERKSNFAQFSHLMQKLEFNCTERKSRIMTLACYAKDGRVIKTYTYQDYEAEWKDVMPESVGEDLLEKVCEMTK